MMLFFGSSLKDMEKLIKMGTVFINSW